MERPKPVPASPFDRIMQAGGFISARVGSAQDANGTLIAKDDAELAMDFAECIGCGACVATCPNSAAMLFVSAKIAHLGILPQGQPERERRALGMVQAMENEAFGACTNFRSCEAVCPKEISVAGIARMNKDWRRAMLWTGGGQSGKKK